MLDRRVFLKASGLAAVSFGLGPRFLVRAALAAPARRKVLIAIFQRGAMDGLAAVPPTSDPWLARLRPHLAMSAARTAGENALIDLGNGFGLNPGFAALAPLWRANQLAIVHGVGSPDPTRSHFDAQDYMETGTPGRKGTTSGWLNRVSGTLGHDAAPFRAVAMTPAMPRSLAGENPAIAVTNLADFKVKATGFTPAASTAGKGFEALYAQASDSLLQHAGRETFEAIRVLSEANLASYAPAPGVEYPRGPLGDGLRQLAQLIKADVGLQAGFAETGGWDTHVAQGTARGTLAARAADLSLAIAAFWIDLGSRRDDVVVLTMTEFGRTVRENGTGGTDHGHGSCLFVLGTRLDGGKVHGRVPSLDPDALYEGRDLPVTTDFRAVFAEVAGNHLGVTSDDEVFPGWSGGRLPLFRA